MFLRNKDEQEVVSRERKDRRDFEHLSELANRMGLYRYVSLACAPVIHIFFILCPCLCVF